MKRVLPWLFLGPLTGPLALCVERRRWVMAAFYMLGITDVVCGLPVILAKLLGRLH